MTVLGATAVEGTLVQIMKAVVIFAFILQVVPLVLLMERKLLGRFSRATAPTASAPTG